MQIFCSYIDLIQIIVSLSVYVCMNAVIFYGFSSLLSYPPTLCLSLLLFSLSLPTLPISSSLSPHLLIHIPSFLIPHPSRLSSPLPTHLPSHSPSPPLSPLLCPLPFSSAFVSSPLLPYRLWRLDMWTC